MDILTKTLRDGTEKVYAQMPRQAALELGLVEGCGPVTTHRYKAVPQLAGAAEFAGVALRVSRDVAQWREMQGVRLPMEFDAWSVRFVFPDVETAVAFKLVWA